MDGPFVFLKSSVQPSFATFPEKHICQWLIKKYFSLQTQKQQKLSTDVNMLWMCYFDAASLLFGHRCEQQRTSENECAVKLVTAEVFGVFSCHEFK